MTDTPNLDLIVRHYVASALWSSTGDDGEPLDAWATIDDVAPATLEAMRDDCAAFIVSAAALIEQCKLSPEQVGHDFWLTRNGHGAGFWDRGNGAAGDALTALCKPFGGVDLYTGDDGLIHA